MKNIKKKWETKILKENKGMKKKEKEKQIRKSSRKGNEKENEEYPKEMRTKNV